MRVFGSILIAASTFGCVADAGDESFVIVQYQAPSADICTFTADKAAPFLSQGVVHLTGNSYTGAPVMESRIVAPDGRESLRTIFIKGANVSLTVGDAFITQDGVTTTVPGPAEPFEYSISFAAALPPNGGIATATYDVIPFSIMTQIKAMVADIDPFAADTFVEIQTTATTTAFGDYYGEQIDSTPFDFPINISNLNVKNLGTCPIDPAVTEIPEQLNACSETQDTQLICCTDDTTGTLACPPILVAAP